VDSPNQNPRWPLERVVLAAHIPPSGKLVMLTLATNTPKDSLDLGKWSPSTYKLAEQTGLKLDTVAKYIRLLEEHGWLIVRRQAGGANQYVLREGRRFGATPAKGASTRSTTPNKGSRTTPVKGSTTTPVNGSALLPIRGVIQTCQTGTDRSDREPDPASSPNEQTAAASPPNGRPKKSRQFSAPRELSAGDADALFEGIDL
jgi:DNA-binding transcriptional MocR family regulator